MARTPIQMLKKRDGTHQADTESTQNSPTTHELHDLMNHYISRKGNRISSTWHERPKHGLPEAHLFSGFVLQ